MKNFIAILLTIAAIGLGYMYVSPTYDQIKNLRTEKAQYDEALTNSQKVQDARDELLGKYNSFAPSDLKRLETLLPNQVDNIRLIIEIDSVAARYNMILKNVQVSTPPTSFALANQALSGDTTPVGSINISFEVSGSYETYRSFIKDIEKSLRIMDVSGVSLSSIIGATGGDKADANNFDQYKFTTSLDTYWLKQK